MRITAQGRSIEVTFAALGSFGNEDKVSLKGSESELCGIGLYLPLREPFCEL